MTIEPLTHPRLLQLFRQHIGRSDEDIEARNRLIPLWSNGNPARTHAPPADAVVRRGAVLAVLYPFETEIMLPLTVRSSELRQHRGEVSLPGGGADPDDPSLETTALREATEELGLDPASVEMWGPLTDLYVSVSNFLITPFVCWSESTPRLVADPREVAEIIHLPLRQLLGSSPVQVEERMIRGKLMRIPFYPFEQYMIWGATSIILSQLAARLQAAIDEFEARAQ